MELLAILSPDLDTPNPFSALRELDIVFDEWLEDQIWINFVEKQLEHKASLRRFRLFTSAGFPLSASICSRSSLAVSRVLQLYYSNIPCLCTCTRGIQVGNQISTSEYCAHYRFDSAATTKAQPSAIPVAASSHAAMSAPATLLRSFVHRLPPSKYREHTVLMAEVIGLVSAIAGLVECTSLGIEFCNKIQNAPHECRNIARELGIVQLYLADVHTFLKSPSTNPAWVQTLSRIDEPGGLLPSLESKLNRMRAKVERVAKPKKVFGITVKPRTLLWPFTQQECDELLRELERAKTLLSAAAQLDHAKLAVLIKEDMQIVLNRLAQIQQDQQNLRGLMFYNAKMDLQPAGRWRPLMGFSKRIGEPELESRLTIPKDVESRAIDTLFYFQNASLQSQSAEIQAYVRMGHLTPSTVTRHLVFGLHLELLDGRSVGVGWVPMTVQLYAESCANSKTEVDWEYLMMLLLEEERCGEPAQYALAEDSAFMRPYSLQAAVMGILYAVLEGSIADDTAKRGPAGNFEIACPDNIRDSIASACLSLRRHQHYLDPNSRCADPAGVVRTVAYAPRPSFPRLLRCTVVATRHVTPLPPRMIQPADGCNYGILKLRDAIPPVDVPSVKTRTLKEGNREVCEILSDSDSSDPEENGLRSERSSHDGGQEISDPCESLPLPLSDMPSETSNLTDFDGYSSSEQSDTAHALQKSDTVWLHEEISSRVRVGEFVVTKNLTVDRFDLLSRTTMGSYIPSTPS
ncbi:hypothetical protein FB451DRAFT_1164677 [Mycena latifolia]|nr:hypothetical protein FB451DRAFT_1164677 [Mycena latifolia]